MRELRASPQSDRVMALLGQGCTNKDIGEQLDISPRTVKAHIHSIAVRNGITAHAGRVRVLLVLAMKDDGPSVDSAKSREAWESLTPRETEAAATAARGFSNKQIGEKMGITDQGVKNLLRLVFDKLGVWTRLELAVWFKAHIVERLTPVGEAVQ